MVSVNPFSPYSRSGVLVRRAVARVRRHLFDRAYRRDRRNSDGIRADALIREVTPGGVALDGARQVAVFAHFDPTDTIHPVVRHHLTALAEAGFATIVSSACENLADDAVAAIGPEVAAVIRRVNRGYDFGSWCVGLTRFRDRLGACRRLLLVNDSVYGPLKPIAPMVERMAGDYDMWGLTDNYNGGWHLQSYFLMLERPVIDSDWFWAFWDRFQFLERKDSVIEAYERGFSRQALAAGLRIGVVGEYFRAVAAALDGGAAGDSFSDRQRAMLALEPANASHYCWRVLIEQLGVPYVKIELLRDNPARLPSVWAWRDVVDRHAPDLTPLILDHLRRHSQRRPL